MSVAHREEVIHEHIVACHKYAAKFWISFSFQVVIKEQPYITKVYMQDDYESMKV